MRAEIRWVRDALAGKDLVEHMTHYLIRDGFVYATNGRLVAGHPFPWEGAPILVPGEALEKVLTAIPEDRELRWDCDDTHLTIRAGRFKSKLRLLLPDLWPFEALVKTHVAGDPIPPDLRRGLASLRPFISDNATQPWATCVGIIDEFLLATNNVAVASQEMTLPPGTKLDRLLPVWAVDFLLLRKEPPESWTWEDTTVTFRWPNGAHVRSTLVEGTFPAKALDLIKDAFSGELNLSQIEPIREAYLRVASLTDGPEIRFFADRIVGGKEELLLVEDDATVPVPEGEECSIFDPRVLTPIIKEATLWNPATWPLPSPFWAPTGLWGVVLGRRAA